MPEELTATLPTAPAGVDDPGVDDTGVADTGVRGRAGSPGACVDAVLVVRDGADVLTRCLDGIAAQTQPPGRLVILDVASSDMSLAIARAHKGVRRAVRDVRVVRIERRLPLGAAIDRAIEELATPVEPRASWVWVLHHDTVAEGAALARLLEAVLRSPSVGVAGPKIVSGADSRQLVEMGIQVTRAGRRVASPALGEADQGQHDGRTDVVAVSTSGMLIRRDAHALLGGFDKSFAEHGAALDFGWRAQLADHRVVVVPGAVVADASIVDDLRGPASSGAAARQEADRRSRRAARQVALARCSPVAVPFLAAWMTVSALVSAVTLLVAKRPRHAWRELVDITAPFHPVVVLGARWRGRRSKRLRRHDLATLFVTPAAAVRLTLDRIHDAITPEGALLWRHALRSTESGPVADDTEPLRGLPASLPWRLATHPGLLVVLVVLGASGAAWRATIAAGGLSPSNTGLAGGELRPVTTGSAGLWHAFRDAWHGAGLGSGVESGPYLAVVAALTWLAERLPAVGESRSSAGVTIVWLLFLTPALSAWSAYLAGRVVTASRLARAVAALAWAIGGAVPGAMEQGRVTMAAAHVLLPFAVAGIALAARRDGTYTATFATALATAVLGAFAPPLLALSACAALVLLLAGPGSRRWRGLVLLVVPAALLGPWAARFVDDWRLLLPGPGLVSTSAQPRLLDVLLAHVGPTLGPPVWVSAPIVVLGLAGYAVRSRRRSESVALAAGAALAVLGLAMALGSSRVVLGSAETGVGVSAPAHPWVGLGVDLWLAGILIGLLAGSRPAVRLVRRPWRRWSVVGAVTLVVVGAVAPAAMAARWAVAGTGGDLTVGRATVPAVAVEQASGPLSNRLLLLRPADGVTDFVLVGQEPGELLRDLDRRASVDDAGLVDAVSQIVGGRGAESLDSTPLAELGIGFVQVRGGTDTPLARRLDASAGLSRLGADQNGILWKVQPLEAVPGMVPATAPSRVRLVDAQGRLVAVVPTVGPHAAVDGPVGPSDDAESGRRLVVAEPAGWADHALVTFDGRRLTPLAGSRQPTYAVPPTAGHLRIDLAAADPSWRLGQAVLLGFVIFMAVPFGNRRSRRRG